MKKFRVLIVSVVCSLSLISCGGGNGTNTETAQNQTETEQEAPECCRKKCHRNPMDRPDISPEERAKFEKWMNFDSLSVDEQKELIKERKAEIDAREAKFKERKAEFEAKWANFDSLSVEEQKELLDARGRVPFVRGKHGHKGGPRPECGDKRPHRNPMDRPEICPEQREKFEKWMNFDSLTVDEQKALIKERKAEIDEREAKIKEKKAEFEAKWANFDNLSIEEQKELLDARGRVPFVKGKHKGCPKGPRPECDGKGHHGPRPDGEHGHHGHHDPRPDHGPCSNK